MLLVYSRNTSSRSRLATAVARSSPAATHDSPVTSTSASTRSDPADARHHTHRQLLASILRRHGFSPAAGPAMACPLPLSHRAVVARAASPAVVAGFVTALARPAPPTSWASSAM